MTKFLARVGRYAVLIGLTVAASVVMWWVSRKNDTAADLVEATPVAATPLAAQPRVPVLAEPLEAQWRDVVVRYSGKIQAWETYSLGFEVGGRVASLGENQSGEPLDDGDRVEAGQTLARLDDTVLRARVAEAVANFEMAAADVSRARRVREVSPSAITEAEYQLELTERAQARAAQQIAEKNLIDATLVSPVAGTIARRLVEPGESINANETVFEIVENDRLRLVVNVPEARVRELELRRRAVAQARRAGAASDDPESAVFRAHVRLEGDDLFGMPWPSIDAEVHRIAERADDVSGLFEVEVEIDNSQRLLRPGMVATAEIVTDRVYAYAAPEPAVLFREDATYAFTVESVDAALPVMFWEVGGATLYRAKRFELSRWIDQGDTVLIPADGLDLSAIVTRGQQRLRDGQLVRIVGRSSDDAEQLSRTPQPVAR
ncbi:efflux RND transporter periplasmic adaptor subunit [Botrimarina sp.]|uniref:efflux RND transporter periplasmic adaptor subunit n=1 Tax=Botrimarina sp. TaxID=2795802 RepID=UPI0032EADCF4